MYNEDYSDIINLPHHQSKTRPHMSNYNRAAQFAPFAALTGHSEAIDETARLTDSKIELDEYQKERINRKIRIITENSSAMPEITVCYFVPDEKKVGGAYVEHTGNVRRIDDVQAIMIFTDGKEIILGDIISVDGKVIDEQMKGY